MTNRRQIPAFGSWNYYDDLPITQYFESAMQAGLVRGQSFVEDADLYQVPSSPAKLSYHQRHQRKEKRGGDKQHQTGQQRKQGKVCDVTVTAPATPRRIRAPKAVDEDLYKIPPELLYQKPKRKRLLRGWSGCLGLHCVA
ncbi:hypothetical protein C4D60_Mb03t17710 [Musa balbisiana]|uniref:RIN4 pathogenic type III effector avirulence factor Avr cleavage site domain-containing protein n=1 Tax=Musa balbisiana TaxID=52838 RepID=A0A4S8JAP8_MUSBA|nr:hypothetical protein C4D60_Mb03t17710 [Musa balbisiana]